jgi:cysteine desulfurase family protein
MLNQTRDRIRALFRCRPVDHVIFTLNGTDANNLALKSLLLHGDHVVTTVMDHNSVLRPLSALERQRGIRWTAVAADPQSTRIDPAAIERAITSQTKLVVVNHASNVTGAIQSIADFGEICRRRNVLFFVDAAQSAGHLEIDFAGMPIDLLATPGHKGLLGPLGTGVLVIRAGVEERMQTVREGGTGSASERPEQPEILPDRFESGSHNAVGLAGLHASLEWLLRERVEKLREHELRLARRFADGLQRIGRVHSFGLPDVSQRVGVFSVRLDGMEPHELASILECRYNVQTRAGLHCAPFAHRTLGTDQDSGLTRFSLGPFLTDEDIDVALFAIMEIAGSENLTSA